MATLPSLMPVSSSALCSRFASLVAIKTTHAANYFAYGYRKMWLALGRAGVDVGRDHVKRLRRDDRALQARRRPPAAPRGRPQRRAERAAVARDFGAGAASGRMHAAGWDGGAPTRLVSKAVGNGESPFANVLIPARTGSPAGVKTQERHRHRRARLHASPLRDDGRLHPLSGEPDRWALPSTARPSRALGNTLTLRALSPPFQSGRPPGPGEHFWGTSS